MANINFNKKRYTPVTLLALLFNVIAKLIGNINFATPFYTIAQLQAQEAKLKNAIEDAINGSRQSRLHRNDVVKETQDMLAKLADYVRSECGGDATKLESSGYELSKHPEPIVVLEAPKYIRASMGNTKGQVNVRWGGVRGSRIYVLSICTGDTSVEANWQVLTMTSQHQFKAVNLKSGSSNSFRVNALGPRNEVGAMSQIAVSLAA